MVDNNEYMHFVLLLRTLQGLSILSTQDAVQYSTVQYRMAPV